MKKKVKIEVFESPLSDKVIYRFESIKDLLKMNKVKDWCADQIAINDCVMLGWDELYDFV